MNSTSMLPNTTIEVCKLSLLGKSIEEVENRLGNPLVSYAYRNSLIYVYGNEEMTTVEFKDRVAVKSNYVTERRSHPRVHPAEKTKVCITGKEKVDGYLKDISLPSAAIIHSLPITVQEGDSVKIDLILPVRGVNEAIRLNGTVYRTTVFDNVYKTVIFFTDPEDSEMRENIRLYIEKRLVDIVMGVYFQNADLAL